MPNVKYHSKSAVTISNKRRPNRIHARNPNVARPLFTIIYILAQWAPNEALDGIVFARSHLQYL